MESVVEELSSRIHEQRKRIAAANEDRNARLHEMEKDVRNLRRKISQAGKRFADATGHMSRMKSRGTGDHGNRGVDN